MMNESKRQMLVFDSAYTYDIFLERDIAVSVTSRDLDGYFDHCWTVHPVASVIAPESSPTKYCSPQTWVLNPRHTFIEGKIGRFRQLAWFPALNFVLAQVELLSYLWPLLRRSSISVVRSEEPLYNGLLSLLFARVMRVPLIIGVWGNPGAIRAYTKKPMMPRLFPWVWLEEIVERFVLRRADCVIVQNEDNRRFVLQKGVPLERTAIFRLGTIIHPIHFVDPCRRADGTLDLEALGTRADEDVLLCISRLVDLKLTDHVVRVVGSLKKKGRVVKALLVGDGDQRPILEALAKELDVENEVIFCGNRQQEWLARVIPKVRVVVSPLTGRALAEAALGGAPIVAYDIDWHGELIETGITGELVPYLDYSLMAEAVERVLGDTAYGQRLGANARKRTLEIMDPDVLRETQIRVYQEVLSRTHRSGKRSRLVTRVT